MKKQRRTYDTEGILSQYRELDSDIDSLYAKQERLRSMAERAGASIIDGKSKPPRADNAAHFERIVDRIAQLEEEMNAKMDRLLVLQEEISATIDTVEDGVLRSLLRYRYLCGWTFEQIAVELNYSYVHIIKNLHPKALSQVRVY